MTQESVTFWRDPLLANMEILQATYISHSFSRHTHDSYAIGVIEAGVEAFFYRGSTYHAPAGTLVIIHPGEVHTGYAGVQAGWQYRMTYPPVELLQRAMAELGHAATAVPFFTDAVIADTALVRQFRALHRALAQDTSPLERESRLLWLAASLIQQYGDVRSPPPPIQRDNARLRQLQTYLHEHYTTSITLEDLAHQIDLPPLKLLRLCRREWGLPPHRYLIQIRVQQAKRLIASGLPLSAVAQETGFVDQSHLTRHFKRLVGVTPGQYQRGCLQAR